MAYIDRITDVWRVTAAVNFSEGQVQETNFNLLITAQGTGDSRTALLTAFNAAYIANINPFMSNHATFIGSRISYVRTAFPYAPIIVTASQVGSAGPDNAPLQARPLIRMRTDLVGRGYRGRMYTPTPEVSQVDTDGNPAGALMTAWLNVMNVYKGGVVYGGTTWLLVLWHRPKPPPAIPIDPTEVTSISSSGRFGTQRKGGAFGRPNLPPW